MPRLLMLYNRPRAERLADAEAGRCPDELLYGLRALRRRGWEIDLTDDGFADYPGGRWLKALDDLLSRGGRRTGFHLKQAWRLRDRLRAADVVFATADSSGLPVLLLKELGLETTPVVYASIGLAESFADERGPIFTLYRRLLRHADRVLAYALSEVDALSRMFALRPERLRFVSFGVETEFFAREAVKLSPRPLSFGFDHRRDWPTLFAAVAGLDEIVEVVANPDVLRGLAIPRNVALPPPEPIDQLRDRLAAAPFVILPVRQNLYTGATISLLQAMAAGKAVIVSRTRAIDDGYGLRDGENCLLVPPGDVPALARAISTLMDDAGLCDRLGRAAAAHVRAHYDIEHYADAIDAALREVRR
jgi:glycosyltransferase involved in cell wall biosynthesis